MIPFILAAVGGYLIADSTKSDATKMADGGMTLTKKRTGFAENGETNFYLDLQKAIEIARSFTLPTPEDVLLEYIEEYWKSGKITPINIPESACNASTILAQASVNNYGKIDTKLEGENLIASGLTAIDIDYVNSDPYETAGGYIKGIAPKGTPFNMYISYDYTGFKLIVRAEVSILTDHYNNNFYGQSTGNGTKEYKTGERVEIQNIATGSTLGDFWGGKHSLSFTQIDLNKIHNFVLTQ